jgi:hypothetical protein
MSWICPCSTSNDDDRHACKACGRPLFQNQPIPPPVRYPQYPQQPPPNYYPPQPPSAQYPYHQAPPQNYYPPQPTNANFKSDYQIRPSNVNDLRAMGGLEAAKLSFGVAAGARAGWAVGKAVGCLVIVAVILGIVFLLGLFSKLTTSSADVPAKTVSRNVATFNRGSNNASPYFPENQTPVTPSIAAKTPREAATATEVPGCLDYGLVMGSLSKHSKG